MLHLVYNTHCVAVIGFICNAQNLTGGLKDVITSQVWCQYTEAMSQVLFMLILHKFFRAYHINVTYNIIVAMKKTFEVKTCHQLYNVCREVIISGCTDGLLLTD